MKIRKWVTCGAILAVTVLACFNLPVVRALVTTTWNYAAKANDWVVYDVMVNNNGTSSPLMYQKVVFTNLALISDTQYYINTTWYSNTTVSPKWDTMDDWSFILTQAYWVNN
ncbi:MAG: hypothetical protein RBG13Loki_4168, partial [Promethearchaeota archaeon CR_4]